MKLFDEHIDYGLGMYRYAVWIVAGAVFSMAGPTALNMILGGYLSGQAYSIVLLIGILISQFAGAIVAGAGVFGALHKIMEDTS